jgi:glycosyltransferase involved in cell wall biosynthesis
MKIIHTPIRFYPFMGGIEHSTYHLAKALEEQDCEVKVICADEGPGKSNETIDHIRVERLPYIGKIANTNISLQLPGRLFQETYDVVHTYMPTPWSADWSILIGKLRGKKTVISVKNDMYHDAFIFNILNKIYINSVMRLSMRLADRIFIVNPRWEDNFVNTRKVLINHKDKIVIVPNGIDLKLFAPIKIKRKQNEILFVSILSKFHQYKGLDDLLAALKEIKNVIPDIHLKIVGDGELRNYYERLADDMGLSGTVTFVGQVIQKDLIKLYTQASVFVLPSKGVEGFGNVVLEALACNTPVVVTDIVGMADDIEKFQCGRVVQPNNPRKLAGALIDILSSKKLWNDMSKNGMQLLGKLRVNMRYF